MCTERAVEKLFNDRRLRCGDIRGMYGIPGNIDFQRCFAD